MNALTDPSVGGYLNRHFVSSFQKIGTFRIVNGAKTGGNVASYFCTPQGTVLHAVAGPVDSTVFLREARWANEMYQLSRIKERTPVETFAFFRNAHVARLKKEHHVRIRQENLPGPNVFSSKFLERFLAGNNHLRLNNQGKVHLLFAAAPRPQLGQIYETVFARILNEKISTNPVDLDAGGF